MPDITPLNGYVLLKRYVKPEKKGLIILNEEKKPQWLGICVHRVLDPSITYEIEAKIEKESLVQFKQYSAVEVEGHPDYILVKEEDIIAILPNPEG